MEELESIEGVVEAAAKRGATSVSSDRQLIADAMEHTRACWVTAVLREKHVADWGAWAFRVAANAAKRIRKTRSKQRKAGLEEAVCLLAPAKNPKSLVELRAKLRAKIIARKEKLIGRQCEVLLKLCEPGISYHRAAKELGMDRSSLRRSFRSGVKRMRGD
jgi:DNA-directed RNA polymerase specialized sigma24 family protein